MRRRRPDHEFREDQDRGIVGFVQAAFDEAAFFQAGLEQGHALNVLRKQLEGGSGRREAEVIVARPGEIVDGPLIERPDIGALGTQAHHDLELFDHRAGHGEEGAIEGGVDVPLGVMHPAINSGLLPDRPDVTLGPGIDVIDPHLLARCVVEVADHAVDGLPDAVVQLVDDVIVGDQKLLPPGQILVVVNPALLEIDAVGRAGLHENFGATFFRNIGQYIRENGHQGIGNLAVILGRQLRAPVFVSDLESGDPRVGIFSALRGGFPDKVGNVLHGVPVDPARRVDQVLCGQDDRNPGPGVGGPFHGFAERQNGIAKGLGVDGRARHGKGRIGVCRIEISLRDCPSGPSDIRDAQVFHGRVETFAHGVDLKQGVGAKHVP